MLCATHDSLQQEAYGSRSAVWCVFPRHSQPLLGYFSDWSQTSIWLIDE